MKNRLVLLVAATFLLPACGNARDERSDDRSGIRPENAAVGVAPVEAAPTGESTGLPEVDFVAEIAPAVSQPPTETTPAPAPPVASAAADSGDRSGSDELAALRAAVDQAPGDVDARRRLAFALNEVGLRQESIPHFEKALELAPGPRAHLELGIAYASVQRLDDAETQYRELLRLAPGDPQALHNLGNLAFRRSDYGQALELYGQAIQAKPDYMLAYFHAAEALRASGNTEQAYAAYLTVLELTPANSYEQGVYNDAVYQLASLALSLGQAAQAENLLAQLLAADPDHGAAHYARGQALLQLGREEEAQREFETHMKIMADKPPSGAVATGQ